MGTLSELFKDILPDENTEREDNYVYAARNFNNDYNIKQELYVFNSPIERDIFCAIKNEEENMYDGYNCTIWKGVDIRVSQPYMYTGDHFDKIIGLIGRKIPFVENEYKVKITYDNLVSLSQGNDIFKYLNIVEVVDDTPYCRIPNKVLFFDKKDRVHSDQIKISGYGISETCEERYFEFTFNVTVPYTKSCETDLMNKVKDLISLIINDLSQIIRIRNSSSCFMEITEFMTRLNDKLSEAEREQNRKEVEEEIRREELALLEKLKAKYEGGEENVN